ncbi:MAG TPA: carboxypeptidase M32 [bacterium]|jgi:carboxypeptidase Taq
MTNVQTHYGELVAKYREYTVLRTISELLHWDMQTIMPPKGAERRADQLALTSGMAHGRLTSPRIGELLSDLEAHEQDLLPEQLANLREITRDYRRATKIPQKLVEELSRHQSVCHEAWVKARESGDFNEYAPFLEKMVRLTAEQAEYLGYRDTPLDALIDEFEPGATTAMFTTLFDELKAANVPLLRKIMASPVKANHRFLEMDYPAAMQKKFGEQVMQAMGFDTQGGRLDTSVHPFCSGTYGDVRITTRYNEHAPQQAIFGIIHETGHALYEQGFLPENLGTPLAEALSYGIHESQSRMWENFVGRSKPFWTFFLPRLKELFPNELAQVSLDQFVLAINHVEPSLVRVEADEMTYDLHIILRFEIERDLFAGKLSISDLPQAWNRKMEEYLGVTPPNNGKEGVMQDVHWSGGAFGYFPSYSLGNMAAGQFWYAMRAQMPGMDQQMEQGNFAEVLHWLRENVHQYGRRFVRNELMQKATGKPLGTADYIRYLNEKYSALYKL